MMYGVQDVARGWELFGLADWQGARDAFQTAVGVPGLDYAADEAVAPEC